MRFSDAFLDELRGAVSISTIVGEFVSWDKEKTNASRGDFWACCPFHGESTPSFHAEDQKGLYKCFGCGAGGDHFKFLTEQGKSFPDAVAFVADLAGIRLPDDHQRDRPDDKSPPPRDPGDPGASEIPPGKWTIVETDPYTDRDGNLLYEVCRIQWKLPDGSWVLGKKGKPKKTFVQRRPSGDGSWVWGLREQTYMRLKSGGDWRKFDGEKFEATPGAEKRDWPTLPHTIFRHPQVEIAISEGKRVFIPEGERKVRAFEAFGEAASCASCGTDHWTDAHSRCFVGADVIIPVDNDEVGRAGGMKKAAALHGIAARVRILDIARFWKECPPSGDIVDWKTAGGTAEQLQAIVDRLGDWQPPLPASRFGARRGRDIAGSRIVYDWLVKGLIERGGVFIVAGEKQAGKSFFVLDLGVKVALGRPYGKGDAGRQVKQGLVVYLAAEDRKGVELRYEGWRRDNDVSVDQDVPFVIMGGDGSKFSLMDDESVDAFIAECLEWERFYGQKLELIFIDTFSRATEGLDEIHGGEVGKVLGRVNRIAEKTKAAVGLVHHFSKTGSVRGHSSLTANVSQVIEVRQMTKVQPNRNLPVETIKDSEGRVVRQAILEKNKNGDNQLKWRFVLRKVPMGQDEDGFEISTCVLDAPSSAVSDETDDAVRRLQGDQKLVFDALTAAIHDEPCDLPNGVRTSIRRGTTEKAFATHVRKVMSFKAPDTEPEKRNAEIAGFMRRNVTALMNAGWMGRDSDHKVVWSLGREDKRRPKAAEPPPPLPADVRAELRPGEPPF